MPALANWGRGRVPELAAAGLLVVVGLSVWLGVRYVGQSDWVRHTLAVETKIAQIWSRLQDAEIGQRSFVLTGEERFLQPFDAGTEGLDGELDELAGMVADNPDQRNLLAEARPLIAERLAFARHTIETRRTTGFDAAREEVLTSRGLEIMRGLRTSFATMQENESRLLAERVATARNTSLILAVFIVLALLGLAGIIAAWIASARRDSRALRMANAELQRNIAEREAAEHQVRQMQKMEAVGQLTGGIAHDFNNMLAVIISGVSLAERKLAKGQPGAEDFLTGVKDAARRAAALVAKLLAFSRQQPLAPQSLDANRLVAGMSDLIARSIGETIRMETILGGGLWSTFADPAQLENALLNLCVNARDAMPEGGRLTLETANFHLDDRYSRIHPGVPPGQYVLIAVTDSGTGMTADVAEKVFDPFFTTKPPGKGTGLGLSQVFGFVKQSGGHIKIYSEPGQGTTVKIYLPRHYGAAGDQSARDEYSARELRGTETILLVEDDASVLSFTATSLRELGYTVLEAAHPNEALAHLRNGPPVELMLTDIVMPDMSGRKLADEALLIAPGLKVLYMTGFTRNAVVHNGVLDFGVHFLAKPFTITELSRKVREALDTRASQVAAST